MKSAFLPFDERLAIIDEVIKPGYAALSRVADRARHEPRACPSPARPRARRARTPSRRRRRPAGRWPARRRGSAPSTSPSASTTWRGSQRVADVDRHRVPAPRCAATSRRRRRASPGRHSGSRTSVLDARWSPASWRATAHGGVPSSARPRAAGAGRRASTADVDPAVHARAPRPGSPPAWPRTAAYDGSASSRATTRTAAPQERWSGCRSRGRRPRRTSRAVAQPSADSRSGRPADLGVRLVGGDRAAAPADRVLRPPAAGRAAAPARGGPAPAAACGARAGRGSAGARRSPAGAGARSSAAASRPASAQAGTTSWAKIPSATNSGVPAEVERLPAAAAVVGDVVDRHLGPPVAAQLARARRSRRRAATTRGGPSRRCRRWRRR